MSMNIQSFLAERRGIVESEGDEPIRYAMEVIRGMQKWDNKVRLGKTNRNDGKVGFTYGSIRGTVKASQTDDGKWKVEVYTSGRKPASLMVKAKSGLMQVHRSSVPGFLFRKLRDKGALEESLEEDDLPGVSLKKKEGSGNYWYVKKGAVTIGVVSKNGEGKYDADTDPDGGGMYKKGFGSAKEAASWIVTNNAKEKASDKKESLGEAKGEKKYAAYAGVGAFGQDQFSPKKFKWFLKGVFDNANQAMNALKKGGGGRGTDSEIVEIDPGTKTPKRVVAKDGGMFDPGVSAKHLITKVLKGRSVGGVGGRLSHKDTPDLTDMFVESRQAGTRPEVSDDELFESIMRTAPLSRTVHERRMRLSESTTWDSKAFCEYVGKHAKVGNKVLRCDNYNKFNQSYDHVIITFVNLPGEDARGASATNNRYQITVDGFSKNLGEPPPSGKVKASTMTAAPVFKESGVAKMRGKTATPEKIAKYVADYISKLSKTEPSTR